MFRIEYEDGSVEEVSLERMLELLDKPATDVYTLDDGEEFSLKDYLANAGIYLD